MIQTATIAAVGVAFAKFTAYLAPVFSEDNILAEAGGLKISAAQLLSIAVILLLTFINTRGIKSGKLVQTTLTIIKLMSLAALIACGLIFLRPDVWSANWQAPFALRPLPSSGSPVPYTLMAALGAMAAAMVGSIFSSDSWHNVAFIAGEIRNPKKNIGMSLFLGTLIVTILYILANITYLAVLPLHDIAFAEKERVAVAVSQVMFGKAGTLMIAAMIMISTFGCNNGLILAGARVYHTMANDGLFFRRAGRLNEAAVPSFALWIQCVVACAWSISGKYGQLLDMISFVVVGFYMLTIAGIFILRKKRPDIERPYKAFGYPVLPVIYIVMGLSFCLLLIFYKPGFTWPGLIIALAGIPVYYLTTARNRALLSPQTGTR